MLVSSLEIHSAGEQHRLNAINGVTEMAMRETHGKGSSVAPMVDSDVGVEPAREPAQEQQGSSAAHVRTFFLSKVLGSGISKWNAIS